MPDYTGAKAACGRNLKAKSRTIFISRTGFILSKKLKLYLVVCFNSCNLYRRGEKLSSHNSESVANTRSEMPQDFTSKKY